MQDISTYQLLFGDNAGPEVPWWWFTALFAWLGVCGLFIWLFGRKLVRPSFAFGGLLVGATVAAAVGKTLWPGSEVMAWVMGGGLVGALAAFVMYRLWMAVTLAAMLAVVAPSGIAMWQGIAAPPVTQHIVEAWQQLLEKLKEQVRDKEDGSKVAFLKMPDLSQSTSDAATKIRQSIDEWWQQIPGGIRFTMVTVCVGGIVAGMIIGMLMPNVSATFATAIIGTLLMYPGIKLLTGRYLPESIAGIIPDTPRGTLILICTVTLIGAVFQWMIFRKPADK